MTRADVRILAAALLLLLPVTSKAEPPERSWSAMAIRGHAGIVPELLGALAQAATPPPGSTEPRIGDAVDSTAWVRLPAESLDVEVSAPAPDSSEAPPDTSLTLPGGGSSKAAPLDTPVPVVPAAELAHVTLEPIALTRAPSSVAGGVYGGYPGWAGAMIVAPADGPAAFRSGVTGLPNVGILWTPGVEVRLHQAPGTYATDGVFLFGNLFLGRSYLNGERDYTAMESGLGYRWILTDRRGPRWIAAVEAGGYWRPESAWPYRPSVRAYWLLVE